MRESDLNLKILQLILIFLRIKEGRLYNNTNNGNWVFSVSY